MIAAEVSIEVHIVHGGLLGELVTHHGLLIPTLPVGSIILHALDSLIELILEHLDALEGFPEHELCESGVELPEFVHVHVESVRPPEHPPDLLLTLLVIQEVLDHLLHLQLLSI